MSEVIWAVRGLETLTVILGCLLAYFSYRGYRRSNSKAYLVSAVGFLLLSIGSLTEGALYESGFLAIIEAQAIRAGVSAVGFILLVFSVFRV